MLDVIRKIARRFANDFQQAFSCQAQQLIRGELFERLAAYYLVDICDGFEDIEQPVFDRGRHLKHLDQIIRDAFRDARLEPFPNGYLRRKTDRIFNQVLNLE